MKTILKTKVYAMNKRHYIVLALAIMLSLPALAETHLGARYSAGISTIYCLPHVNETWRLTPYDAGIVYRYYAEIERHKYFNIGLQIELNYAARRYVFDDYITSDIPIDDSNFKIDTLKKKKIYSQVIEIPVIMQWQFPITQNFRIYVNGLIYAAYYVKNEAFYIDSQGQSVTERFDYKNWRNFDFGIGGGLGVGYKIGSYEIGVDARFLMGISELYPQEPKRYESLPQQLLLSISVIRKMK